MKKKIKKMCDKQKLVRITRNISKEDYHISGGYLVKVSDKFIVVRETEDFRLLGFIVLPVNQIKKIQYNKSDDYYDKIMELEGEKKSIGLKKPVNLKSYNTLFKSLKGLGKFVIVECENSEKNEFVVGEIQKVGKKSVSILYVDPQGNLDKKPTKIKFKKITRITFNDRYIDVLKKYVR